MNQLKIIIAGGTGFIGQEMARRWSAANEVVILTRCLPGAQNNGDGQPLFTGPNIRYVVWDGATLGAWTAELNDAHLLINLAGKSVNCRYHEKNKAAIMSSRVNATKVLGLAIQQVTRPPRLWINGASATIYRHATDRPQDEATGDMENDFSVQVCKQWEKTFFEQRTAFTRKVALRMAIVLGAGGVMRPYFNLLKFGLGGHQGSGRQMYSWVHIADVCRMVEWLYQHESLEGVYNCSSPHPVTNAVFMQTLRQAAGHRIGLPAPAWMLHLGAALIGTETELILKSRWVVPTRILEAGFTFQYPLLADTVHHILQQVPRKHYHLF